MQIATRAAASSLDSADLEHFHHQRKFCWTESHESRRVFSFQLFACHSCYLTLFKTLTQSSDLELYQLEEKLLIELKRDCS